MKLRQNSETEETDMFLGPSLWSTAVLLSGISLYDSSSDHVEVFQV